MLATSNPHLKQKRLVLETKEKLKKKCTKHLFDDDTDLEELEWEFWCFGCVQQWGHLQLGTVSDMEVDDYVVCEYGVRKSSLLYVGIVTKEVGDEIDVEVYFLRKSDKVNGKFVKADVEEIVNVPMS